MEKIYEIIEENRNKLYNEDLCQKCAGKCCKSTPCSYFSRDLVLTKENIIKMLDDGKTCIKVKIMSYKNGKKVHTVPVPYISVRGRKKPAIDLLSESNRCIALTSTGCSLEEKPSGAKVLIPNKDGYGPNPERNCYNILKDYQHLVLLDWLKYSELLVEVIEDYTNEKFEKLYVEDLIKCGIAVLYQSDIMSDYNYSSLYPILKSMGILDYIRFKKGSIENPSRNAVNDLRPTEESYQKVYKMF